MTENTTAAEFEAYPNRVTGELVHDRAGRYAKQLISHWGNDSAFTDEASNTTIISFRDLDPEWVASTKFEVKDDRAVFTVAGPSVDNAKRVAESVEEHILRFAGTRDTLEFSWGEVE